MDALNEIDAHVEPFPRGVSAETSVILTVRPRGDETEFNITVRPESSPEERRAAEEWGREEMRRLVMADYQCADAEDWNLFVLEGLPAWQRWGVMRLQ